jgi:sirohydrochlorin cobaltochelatase
MKLMRFFGIFGLAFVATTTACTSSRTPAKTESAASAQPSARGFGVLVMAHGGTPEWNASVLETLKPLRSKYDIEVAFGMADATTLQEGVRKLEARNVAKIGVVRLFVSGESWTRETEQILGLEPGAPDAAHPAQATHASVAGANDPHAHHGAHDAGAAPPPGHGAGGHGAHAGHGGHGDHQMAFFRVQTAASYALSVQGLADADGMGVVLADRAAAMSKDAPREDVLILAHGPGDDGENSRWLAKLDARANAIRARAKFHEVRVETLREDWPDKRVEAEKRIRAFIERSKAEGRKAIVVPFRVQGFGPYKDVLAGLDYVADGTGLIPHAEVAKWIGGQIALLESGPFRPSSAR